jgi:hypothetical protein
MSFDYEYTCPIIDGAIDDVIYEIEEGIKSLISDINIAYEKYKIDNDGEDFQDVLDEYVYSEYSDSIISNIKESLEKVRDSNSDMRKSADMQIYNLENAINDLEEEFKYEKEKLESEFVELENEITRENERLQDIIEENIIEIEELKFKLMPR